MGQASCWDLSRVGCRQGCNSVREQYSSQRTWGISFWFVFLLVLAAPANANFAQGQRLYFDGRYAEAVEHWRSAGWVEDDFMSQVTLGELYDNGTVVPRDHVEAYVWLYLALINPSDLGRTDAAIQTKSAALQRVIKRLDALYFPMSKAEQEDAGNRIVYILSSRGADGFFRLGEIFQDASAHQMCGATGSAVAPSRQNPHYWLFCEQATASGSMNALRKNHVDSLAYFTLAEREGNAIARTTMDSYAAALSNVLRGEGCSETSTLPYPINCRDESFFQELKVAAKRRADTWVPPFEVYPSSHSDQSTDEIEDIAALNRIEELRVSSIQEALAFLGHYRGTIDNAYGEQTKQAITKYQASIGAKVTGTPTPKQIVGLIKKVASSGHANTQVALGTMYFHGYGVARDYRRARIWFERAAAQRHPYAHLNLGVMYRDSLGVESDDQRAAIHFKTAMNLFHQQPERSLVAKECAKLVGRSRCN